MSHTKALGVLWIIYGMLGILMGLLILGVLFGISFLPDDHESPIILRTVALAGGGLIALLSLCLKSSQVSPQYHFVPNRYGSEYLHIRDSSQHRNHRIV